MSASATDADVARSLGACACGASADGYDAELDQPICASCAAFVAAIRQPTTLAVDDSTRTIQAGPDVEEIVDTLRDWMADAQAAAERAPTAEDNIYHRGRAAAHGDVLRLLHQLTGGVRDA